MQSLFIPVVPIVARVLIQQLVHIDWGLVLSFSLALGGSRSVRLQIGRLLRDIPTAPVFDRYLGSCRRWLLLVIWLEGMQIGLSVAVLGGGLTTLSDLSHRRVLFPGVAISLRWEDRLNGIPALLLVDMLRYKLSHRKLNILKVLQKLLIEGKFGIGVECVVLLD